MGTVKRELWEVQHFATRQQAERRLAQFIDDYNHRRAHMGIAGLTPADRFMGRADRVLAEVDAISRKRQGALLMTQSSIKARRKWQTTQSRPRMHSGSSTPLSAKDIPRAKQRSNGHFAASRTRHSTYWR